MAFSSSCSTPISCDIRFNSDSLWGWRARVLKRTTILLDPRALGVETVASLELEIDYSRVDELVERICGLPGIVFCTPSLGRKDIFAIAFLESVEELSRINFQLKGLEGVREVKSSIWIEDFLLCPENFDLSRAVA